MDSGSSVEAMEPCSACPELRDCAGSGEIGSGDSGAFLQGPGRQEGSQEFRQAGKKALCPEPWRKLQPVNTGNDRFSGGNITRMQCCHREKP